MKNFPSKYFCKSFSQIHLSNSPALPPVWVRVAVLILSLWFYLTFFKKWSCSLYTLLGTSFSDFWSTTFSSQSFLLFLLPSLSRPFSCTFCLNYLFRLLLRKNLIIISLEDCRWPNGKNIFFFYLRFLSMFVFMFLSLFSLSGSESTMIYLPFPFSSGFALGSLTKPRLYLPEDEV